MNEERYRRRQQPPNPAESYEYGYAYRYGPHPHPQHPPSEWAHAHAEPAPWAAGPKAESAPARSEAADQEPGGGAVLAHRAGGYSLIPNRPDDYGWGQGRAGDTGHLPTAGWLRGAGPGRIADPHPITWPRPESEPESEPADEAAPAARRQPDTWSAPAPGVEVGPAVFAGPSVGSAPHADVTRFPSPLARPAPGADPGAVSAQISGPEAKERRFSAVDGLRGVAVLAVLSHDTGMGGPYFSWTGAGIDVLLVLSAFLTTLPLLRRATATGRTGVVGFLTRRAKRLIPALLVSVALTLTVCWALGSPRVIRDLVRQIPTAPLGDRGWADWAYGRPLGAVPTMDSPLAPLWLWDVTARSVVTWSLLLACLCLVARRRLAAVALAAALLTGAATVAAARGELPGMGVVVGMQTLALPAGVGAACLVHLAERGHRAMSRAAATLLTTAGLVTAAALAVSAVLRGAGQGDHRYGVVVVLGAALLTALLCGDRGPLARLLSGGLLTEIGRMSYSLFLLHLPVYWLLRRGQPELSSLGLFLVGGGVTWFLSLLLHYLLVERLASTPWRRGRASHRPPRHT
ncbi:acyltransferase family protein [Streptomyces sp. SP18BB07]|uniref:acyltransferase family protein n=1 Tax=Streptomyces sp. SP18BB07 TaxID=3002522 RepID=UPI002E77D7FD|nr:acyltransferase family protein [Streptomyces sp. SP18BB07]MEE1764299.1 acyltransferase family protein [Streptomyces sp. SP18BB07]